MRLSAEFLRRIETVLDLSNARVLCIAASAIFPGEATTHEPAIRWLGETALSEHVAIDRVLRFGQYSKRKPVLPGEEERAIPCLEGWKKAAG